MLDWDAIGGVVRAGVGIAVLVFALTRLRALFVDTFRYRMNGLKRRLAQLPRTSRTDEATVRLAQMIEVMLRYADKLSLSRLFFMQWSGVTGAPSDQSSLDTLLAKSDATTQAQLRAVRLSFVYEVIRQLMFGSIVTWPLLIVAIPIGTLIGAGRRIHERLTQPTIDRVENALTRVLVEDAVIA